MPKIHSIKISKKSIFLIVTLIFGFIVVINNCYSATNYPRPQDKIAQKIIEKITSIKSLEYEGQITGKIKNNNFSGTFFLENKQPTTTLSDKKEEKFMINFKGFSNLSDLDNPQTTFKLDINTENFPQPLKLEGKIINKEIYLKLIDDFKIEFFDFSPLKNQWIKINPETAEQKEQIKSQKLEKKLDEKQKLSLKEIGKIINQTRAFRITKKLPDEKINGLLTSHYKFIVDKKGLERFFNEINKKTSNKSSTENKSQKLNEILQSIEILEGDIWVNKKNFLISKIILNLNIKETDKVKSSGKLTALIQFKNYNKSEKIDLPASAKTIEEIMSEFLDKYLQNLQFNPQLPNQQ